MTSNDQLKSFTDFQVFYARAWALPPDERRGVYPFASDPYRDLFHTLLRLPGPPLWAEWAAGHVLAFCTNDELRTLATMNARDVERLYNLDYGSAIGVDGELDRLRMYVFRELEHRVDLAYNATPVECGSK